jgi:hypothetical protein
MSRVVARAGVGLWRHRVGVLLAVILCAGVGTYTVMTGLPVGSNPLAIAAGGAGASNGDCADTAMAAIADKSPDSAQRAYQCMDQSFQQRVPEQVFVQQMQTQALPNVQKLQRVGEYQTPAGGAMVYYAVDTSGQSVGYIVYLSQDGKVLRIE